MHDGHLLKQYLTERSEAAIRELVDRYKETVISQAWRQLGDASAAEDIAQQVFLILVRKAHWLVNRPCIAGWLHRATFHYCARHRLREFRRSKRERAFSESETVAGIPVRENREALRHIDAALNSLPLKEREALVLRFYRGQSLKEVGESLGTTEEAARKRVSRGMDRLTDRLRKQGVVVAAGTILASVMTDKACAASAGFAAKTMSAATAAGLFAKTGAIAAIVSQFSLLTKTQVAGIVLLAASIPAGMQWRKNQRLAEEIQRLKDQPAQVAQRAPAREERPQAGQQVVARAAVLQPVAQAPAKEVQAAMVSLPGSSHERQSRESRQALDSKHRVEVRVAAITASLSLSESQEARVKAVLLESAPEKEVLNPQRGPGGSASELAALLRLESERIKEVLSPGQQVQWEEFLSKERQNRIERRAAQDVLFLQGEWQLDEEQKEAAWKIVSDYVEKEDDQRFGRQAGDENFRERREAEFLQILSPAQQELYLKHQAEHKALREELHAQMEGPVN